MQPPSISYKRHRSPPQIIAHAVWLYVRFNLSLREVEEVLLERGIDASYESIRRWTSKFGPQISGNLRRRQPRPGEIWHMDEVVVKIAGRSYWLWRAVDANGDVLDILVQSRRNTSAAKRFFRKLFRRWGQPRVLVTDKLGSYAAAKAEIAPGIEHRQHKGLSNRAEASHRHTRRQEQIMGRFKPPGQAQRYLSAHHQIATLFRPKRHRLSARSYRHARSDAFSVWADYAADLAV